MIRKSSLTSYVAFAHNSPSTTLAFGTGLVSSAALLLLGCLLGFLCMNANAQTKPNETVKVGPIMQILARKEFAPNQPEKPFCAQFLKDFKTLNGMRFIEPKVVAQNYDEPALASFKARCGKQPLNEIFACDGRATADVKWEANPAKRRQQNLEYCSVFYGTRNFKIFQLDANNDPKDGEEIVVYFERTRGPANRPAETTITGDGGYYAYSAKSCSPIAWVPTHDPYNYFFQRPVENHNGVISYRSKFYVFDLYALIGSDAFPADPHYRLHVSTLNSARGEWCSYSTLSVRRALEENRKKRTEK